MHSPELWKFNNYTQIQVEKDKAKKLFGPVLGDQLADGKAVVLIPVDCIDDYIDAEFEELPNGEPHPED
jgi:hypothetical protein